jgi:hypothetical protein
MAWFCPFTPSVILYLELQNIRVPSQMTLLYEKLEFLKVTDRDYSRVVVVQSTLNLLVGH